MKVLILFCLLVSSSPVFSQSDDPDGLATYYAFSIVLQKDGLEKALPLLKKSVDAGCREACAYAAYLIDAEKIDFNLYGKSIDEAQLFLFEQGAKGSIAGNYDLATFLRTGPKDLRDLTRARKLFKKGAEELVRKCWFPYAEMCMAGEGGDVDLPNAYFHFACVSKVSAPGSFYGSEARKRRDEISKRLGKKATLEQLGLVNKWLQQKEITMVWPTEWSASDEEKAEMLIKMDKWEIAHLKRIQ